MRILWPLTLPLAFLAILAQGRNPPKPQGDPPARRRDGSETEMSRAERYFAICDHDANGWISFVEASASLGLNHDTWKSYDTDNDGRILAIEFKRRYEDVLASGGPFLPPKKKAEALEAIPERADEALETYDKNRDGGLDTNELEILLVRVGAVRLEAETSIEQFDRDLTRKLESAEIEDLLSLLKPSTGAAKGPRPRTIDELFGKLVPREIQEGSTPQPVRIMPPVRSFRRLDIDADGHVTLEDLQELQRPLVLPVRSRAILAALDTNGDGALDEAEFRASMRSAP